MTLDTIHEIWYTTRMIQITENPRELGSAYLEMSATSNAVRGTNSPSDNLNSWCELRLSHIFAMFTFIYNSNFFPVHRGSRYKEFTEQNLGALLSKYVPTLTGSKT